MQRRKTFGNQDKVKNMNTKDFRYQVYSLKDDGSVNKPLTTPFERKNIALSYYNECVRCALVRINQYGSIVEILEKNPDSASDNKKKEKYVNRR